MSRLVIPAHSRAQATVEGLYQDLERRIATSQPGLCCVSMARAFLSLCQAQGCGKCVPCHVGLAQLGGLLDDVLEDRASLATIDLIERTAEDIYLTADCAIGYQAAAMVLDGVRGFRDDYEEHVLHGRCACSLEQPVPCVALCPAGVDVPGYVSLVAAGREADAVRLIRKDNPFPSACAYVCEHPCEARCRRTSIDAAVSIRALKRYAVDHAGSVPAPDPAPATGKRVAVIGGGPGGLSCAYYLALMGHEVTVFEKRRALGGMLRYGIPAYRLPRGVLDADIATVLSLGVEVRLGVNVGADLPFDDVRAGFDATYICIGAHDSKALGVPGEDLPGVLSAVELLRSTGAGERPDFGGKRVVVVGGGNVAMDVARTARRLGAAGVDVVYRRRVQDMTALPEEVEGARAEGCEVVELAAPVRFVADETTGRVAGLVVQPQVIGPYRSGRPAPRAADAPERTLPCDVAVVAIGQAIESEPFCARGIPVSRGAIVAGSGSAVEGCPGLFAGGDCVTGPATVIRAIEAGKVAAANIDEYLGFSHQISAGVQIPEPPLGTVGPCGRVNVRERDARERVGDFELIEHCMSREEAQQEAGRCLRCDHYGYGIFRRGRTEAW
jgi:NADPH-dependent glutamate synthase beta subunit-like oxidoreductase